MPAVRNSTLVEWSCSQAARHGGSTRADPRGKSFGYWIAELKDLLGFDASRTQAGRYNAYLLNTVHTYWLMIATGAPLRVFTKTNTHQMFLLLLVAIVAGYLQSVTILDHRTHLLNVFLSRSKLIFWIRN